MYPFKRCNSSTVMTMSTIDAIHQMPSGKDKEAVMTKSGTAFASVLSWIDTQLERRKSRRSLLEMSDDQLKDIGISRAEAYREGNKAMWI